MLRRIVLLLAIVLAARREDLAAREAFDAAARLAPDADAPFYWRGRFRAARGDHAGAVADIDMAASRSAVPFREWAALSELLPLVGRAEEAAVCSQQGDALDAPGFVAERAAFRAAVLQSAEQSRPDVVFMDIGMPKLNGYDCARRIREAPWGKGMTLVAISGWGQDSDRAKSKSAGFDAHLVKPVEAVALQSVIATAENRG